METVVTNQKRDINTKFSSITPRVATLGVERSETSKTDEKDCVICYEKSDFITTCNHAYCNSCFLSYLINYHIDEGAKKAPDMNIKYAKCDSIKCPYCRTLIKLDKFDKTYVTERFLTKCLKEYATMYEALLSFHEDLLREFNNVNSNLYVKEKIASYVLKTERNYTALRTA